MEPGGHGDSPKLEGYRVYEEKSRAGPLRARQTLDLNVTCPYKLCDLKEFNS